MDEGNEPIEEDLLREQLKRSGKRVTQQSLLTALAMTTLCVIFPKRA